MASLEKVTVDKAYFDALLRRADFHTSAQLLGRPETSNVAISRVEYDSLLRVSREYELLKSALFQGGVSADTLELLISGSQNSEPRNDSGVNSAKSWTDDFTNQISTNAFSKVHQGVPGQSQEMPWRPGVSSTTFNLSSASGTPQNGNLFAHQSHLRVPPFQRQVSYGMSSMPEDMAFEEDEDLDHVNQTFMSLGGVMDINERRTVYMSGFSERTTYHDLVSVIKGGKLLSINLRAERSATVTFHDPTAAADFLTWAKRNDIYLHSKRIEVKWADRQYKLNNHIANKVSNGATRNVIIRSALDKGLSESQISEDMEHIHNLVIIDITLRGADPYVSMNSVHNALFARTCMMSRATYKGCKIEFVRDECDAPLPARMYVPKVPAQVTVKKAVVTNRFDMLNLDDGSSDEENRTPSENESDTQTIDTKTGVGVRLDFLDSESA